MIWYLLLKNVWGRGRFGTVRDVVDILLLVWFQVHKRNYTKWEELDTSHPRIFLKFSVSLICIQELNNYGEPFQKLPIFCLNAKNHVNKRFDKQISSKQLHVKIGHDSRSKSLKPCACSKVLICVHTSFKKSLIAESATRFFVGNGGCIHMCFETLTAVPQLE